MAIEDPLQQLLAMKPSLRAAWIKANAGKLTADQLVDIRGYASTATSGSADRNSPEVSSWQAVFEETNVQDKAIDTAEQRVRDLDKTAEQRVDAATSGARVNPDLDGSGNVDPDEQAAIDKAKDKVVKSQAAATGRGEDEVRAEVEQVTALSGISGALNTKIPEWLIEANGDIPSDAMIQQLIENYNEANPLNPIDITRVGSAESVSDPNLKVNSISEQTKEQLWQRLQRKDDPLVAEVVDATLLGRDPIVQMVYKTRNAQGLIEDVTVSADQTAQIQAAGWDNNQTSLLIRAAARSGITDATGKVAWQPYIALARAAGLSPTATGKDPGSADSKERYAESRTASAQKLALKYKEGLKTYGNDPALAYLYSLDPALAARIAMNPETMAGEDRLKAMTMFGRGGFSEKEMKALGYETFGSTFGVIADGGWFNDQAAFARASQASGSGGSGGGRVRVAPDDAQIEQAVTDLWRKLFRSDPSGDQIGNFKAKLAGIIKTTPMDKDIDVTAAVRQYAEGSDEYKTLYAKAGGKDPAEYQSQFLGAAADMLGNEAPDDEAIRQGMRSGQYQTTVGAVAGSAQALKNSRFLGRLASAAQLVNEST